VCAVDRRVLLVSRRGRRLFTLSDDFRCVGSEDVTVASGCDGSRRGSVGDFLVVAVAAAGSGTGHVSQGQLAVVPPP
jgi:hypothetical protein